MHRNFLRGKTILALVLPMALAGAAFAGGGADCNHGKQMAAGHEKGSHCLLAKNVVKDAKMTDDGAIVTLKGKTAEAVSHIQEHLGAHAKGVDCPGCPLSMDGVTTDVNLTDEGGTLTVRAGSPEAVKAVQEWASKPVGACCGKEKGAKA